MEEIQKSLRANLQFIHERMHLACQRAGRSNHEVTLVAVTKYAELEWVRELVKLGVVDLGESRPQHLIQRVRELSPEVRWHFIGHLQRNKAADVMSVASIIHSVDSLRLFERLAELGAKQAVVPRVLLEVNVSGEASKDGFSVPDLLAAWPAIRATKSLEVLGLMTMAPLSEDPEAARPVFRQLRSLRDQLHRDSDGRWALGELSMGMSGDFEVGIEEGATLIRVGSRLFENLPSIADN